ncbi:MAG: COX15/CtaA family protein [Thermoplasmata archaeon]|nr:COX15/CtaA family protein [Thermoplasmata archaeon]
MDGHRWFRYATIAAVIVCYATILIGGNVMASDSGLACPDWPSCHGTFTPPLAGGAGIEWAHRLSALVLSLTIAGMTAIALVVERARPALLRLSGAASLLVLAQALLGGVVVESELTVGIVLLHLALATGLFALLLLLSLLANFREIPKPWVEFARRASEELPASERLARSGHSAPGSRAPAPPENRPASPGA